MRAGIFSPPAMLLALLSLFILPVHGFDEGIDYRTLAQPQPTADPQKVEVRELFWYGCPHCFYLEPGLRAWLKKQPDYVEFVQVPAVLGPTWANHARAFYAAEILDVLEQTHGPFFSALHEQKQRLFSADEIANWYAGQGVNKEEFLRAYNSFIIDVKIRRSRQYGENVGLDGVPSVVVNGKYITSPSMAGGSERMFKLLDYLIALEAGKNPQDPEELAESAVSKVEQAPTAAVQPAVEAPAVQQAQPPQAEAAVQPPESKQLESRLQD